MKETQLGPMIARYGLIGGLIMSLIFLVTAITGIANGANPASGIMSGLLQLAICIGLVIMAIKKQRDEVQEGYITLGQCVLLGTGILVLAGLLATVVSIVYTNFVDPNYMENIMATMEEKWEEQGLSEEQIESAKSWTATMKNPVLTSASSLACYGFGGAILSLIIGLIMKKERPEFS